MEPFKNNLSPQLVKCIAKHLEKHLKPFDRAGFEKAILQTLDTLELKERSQLIATTMHQVLPNDHSARFAIIRALLRPYDSDDIGMESDTKGIRGWGMFPLGMVVGQNSVEVFEEAMLLLKDMTSLFSSELDIRYFILADQDRALAMMQGWVKEDNYHVRRLVSEGTRPRLPWAMQLPQLMADPSPTLPLLEALRDDKEEYVRRSVANHLNDIAKDHPDLVAKLAVKWMKGAAPSRQRLLKHACRTLIKQGHPVALKAFGFGPPRIKLATLSTEQTTVQLGDSLLFAADIASTHPSAQTLVVDYLLHFKKANGTQVGKVFKWKTLTLAAGETVRLEKNHSIRAITTRKYYDGTQGLSLRVNGEDFGYVEFELVVSTCPPKTTLSGC